MESYTKFDFAERLSKKTNFTGRDIVKVLNAISDCVLEDLNKKGESRIPGVAHFKIGNARKRVVKNAMRDHMKTGAIDVKPSVSARVLYTIKSHVKR